MARTALLEIGRIESRESRQSQCAARWSADASTPGLTVAQLKSAVTNTAIQILQSNYGVHRLSPLHREAVKQIVECCIDVAFANKERVQGNGSRTITSIPAPTGIGKSTVVKVLAAAMALQGRNYGLRVAVLTTRLDELWTLFKETAELLLSGETSNKGSRLKAFHRQAEQMTRVGLIHEGEGHKGNPLIYEGVENEFFAPTPEEDLPSCSVVFATQQKANGVNGEGLLSNFDLYLLDEDLGVWQTEYMTVDDLDQAIDYLQCDAKWTRGNDGELLSQLLKYADKCKEAIRIAIGATGSPVQLPLLAGEESARIGHALERYLSRHRSEYADSMRTLVKWAGAEVDVRSAKYKYAQGTAFSFRHTIPSYMQSVVQLDAQAGHDAFKRIAPDIQTHPWFTADRQRQLKSYSSCVLHWANVSSSKESISRSHQSPSKSSILKLLHDVIENQLPRDEGILILYFRNKKDRKHNSKRIDEDLYMDVCRGYLKAKGIDVNQRIKNANGIDIPRIAFLRWGQHRATNRFRHYSHVFTFGVLRRKYEDIQSQAIAATGRADVVHPHIDLQAIQANEIARNLTQAANRTAMRIIKDSKAEKATIWLVMKELGEAVVDELATQHLPGIQFQPWPGLSKEDWPIRESRAKEVAAALQSLFAELDVDSIRSAEARQRISCALSREVRPDEITRAKKAYPDCFSGWTMVGYSWKRS